MTTQSPTLSVVPGYVAGTWDIDPVHSEVSFVVRHMVVSKVRGRFDKFEGVIVTGENPLESSVEASVEAGSINTNQEQRDAHVRSADFLDVDNHPQITFRSLAVRPAGDQFLVDGDLTIRGERFLARSLRRDPGWILGHHRDQP
jgi:polyisoprenoid-binding protein YceI